MEELECPVCMRMVKPIGTSWTGWRAGLGSARGTAIALHGPRELRCAGREHVAAYVTPREATYTAQWEQHVGPVPERTRVSVFDFDPDGPTQRWERVTDPGHVWLVLVDVDSTHGLDRIGSAVKVPDVRVNPGGAR